MLKGLIQFNIFVSFFTYWNLLFGKLNEQLKRVRIPKSKIENRKFYL